MGGEKKVERGCLAVVVAGGQQTRMRKIRLEREKLSMEMDRGVRRWRAEATGGIVCRGRFGRGGSYSGCGPGLCRGWGQAREACGSFSGGESGKSAEGLHWGLLSCWLLVCGGFWGTCIACSCMCLAAWYDHEGRYLA